MGFRDRLVTRMKQLSITQKELADRAGLAAQSISKYVRDQGKPNYKAIVALAEALEVHPVWFFEDMDLDQMRMWQEQLRVRREAEAEARLHDLDSETLVIGHWLSMRHLPSPFQGYSLGIASQLYGLIFSRLIQWSYTQAYDDLAVDWKQVEEGWLFQLRQGVRFHDGTSLSAEDVRWSYEQYLRLNPTEQNLQGVEAVDEDYILLHTRQRCHLTDLVMPCILPAGTGDTGRLVGTGPFELISQQDREWKLRASSHYFRSRPYLSRLVVKEYDSKEALEKAILSGKVHYARGVYVTGDDLVCEVEPTFKRYQLHFMMREPLVQDRRLRRAIALGLDREALAESVGLRSPYYSVGPFDTILGDLSDTPIEPDADQARHLLESVPDVFNQVLRVASYPRLPDYQNFVTTLCEQLEGLGLQVEQIQVGGTAHIVVGTRPVGLAQVEARHWLSDDRLNLNGYDNPKVDSLIRRNPDGYLSLGQLEKLRHLIQEDIPDIPLFYDETPFTYVSRLRVRGGVVPSMNRLFEIHNWYLEPGSTEKEEGS